ncbi:hypothetical protein MOQ72_41480 [Saccharopolyspora sp. K220]|uniref:hypothetical protein n=1 Tax=Saccharopolyspora soli TaxID=2926618 RepID=UPI001F59F341|nr:hypothetical protein [Saccharopolyspora soli]MCI2423892.1 hypothetical protein [Saccharopolyspora soli]
MSVEAGVEVPQRRRGESAVAYYRRLQRRRRAVAAAAPNWRDKAFAEGRRQGLAPREIAAVLGTSKEWLYTVRAPRPVPKELERHVPPQDAHEDDLAYCARLYEERDAISAVMPRVAAEAVAEVEAADPTVTRTKIAAALNINERYLRRQLARYEQELDADPSPGEAPR